MQLNDVIATAADRPVYVWGARHDGLGMLKALQRSGVEPEGFIDNNPLLHDKTVMGKTVFRPQDVIDSESEAASPFVFVASGYFADEISDECDSLGLAANTDYVVATDLQYFNYQIDHAGYCNLRCISCAVANFASHHPGGFMSADTFEKVAQKIVKEDPFVGMLRLYDWGEPLLNPAFADILEVTNQYGMLSVLSSNLNVIRNLDNVVKAKPTWFRVSNSGFGKNYELTHTGGRWDVFYKNLLKLAEARAKYHPEMEVELFFHIYKHNRDDFPKMQALCDELGFILRYTHAYVFPLDHVESIVEGRPVNDMVKKTCDLLHLKVEDAVELARQERDRPCYFERFIRITWDLKMTQCINWYDPGLMLCETDFLTTPFQEIVALKRDMELCKRCKKNALHRYCNVYGDNKLIHKIESVKVA
jgi:MoaA/NifB/PqqE/SkfB family radical SAM enzyme